MAFNLLLILGRQSVMDEQKNKKPFTVVINHMLPFGLEPWTMIEPK
jgi:hypothetical protein